MDEALLPEVQLLCTHLSFLSRQNFGEDDIRQLVLPKPIKGWTLTTLRDRLVKTVAKAVRHARYVFFQVAVPRQLFAAILGGSDGFGWQVPRVEVRRI